MNYNRVAIDIIKFIGGKENVLSVVHCITRLRFKLKDTTIPNREEIKNIDGVISVIEQGGQFQVVIGNQVENVFNEVIKLIDNENKFIEDQENIQTIKEEKKKISDVIASTVGGIFIPVIGAMAATGLLKALIALLTTIGVLSTDSGTYSILYAMSDAFFYFFPIILGASTAKFFKMDQYVGMVIGGSLLYPTIVGAASDGSIASFLGIPMNIIKYSSTIFPIIVAIWFASNLEKGLRKVIPQSMKLFLVPAITILTTVPLTLFIFGPATNILSGNLSKLVVGIYALSPILTGLLLGGIWILVVMFGLHWSFIPIYINNMTTLGYEPLTGLLMANIFAMVGTLVAIAIKTKKQDMKTLAWTAAFSNVLGVSEPGIYGILLPLKKPFVISCIAGGIGGAVAGAFGTVMYGAGVTGIFQLTLALGPNGVDKGFIGCILSIVIAFLVGFILTYFFGYSTKESKTPNLKAKITV